MRDVDGSGNMKTLGESREQVQVEKRYVTMVKRWALTLSTGLGHLAPTFSFAIDRQGHGHPVSSRKVLRSAGKRHPCLGTPSQDLGACMVHLTPSTEFVFQLLRMI